MITNFERIGILILSFGIVTISQPALSLPPEQHIQNEQQWIVDSIGGDIAGMIAFAAQKNAAEKPDLKTLMCKTTESPANASTPTLSFNYALSYQGALKPISTKIELSRYIWNPSNYATWASYLITRFHLKANPASPSNQSTSLIKELSNYSPDLLISQNKKISSALTANPLDPQLHEEAALLCATLAMRECADSFSDERLQLDRLVAHLAVARALHGSAKFGDAGQLAEIILCSMSGREVESSNLMKPLASRTTDNALQSWLRAVRVRNTYDFRIADAKNGSMIERLEYGRALTTMIGCDALSDYLEKRHEDGSAIDWLRCGFGALKLNSVEAGHRYAEPAVEAEQAGFLRDYALTHDGEKQPASNVVIDQLNLAPTGCLIRDPQWHLQAISWPNLAAFHCRHLLCAVRKKYMFELLLWGVKDQAQETLEQSETAFSKLNLFPVCQMDMIKRGADEIGTPGKKTVNAPLTGRVTQLILRHPDWFTYELWALVKTDLRSPAIPKPTDSWFKPPFLMGTNFNFISRGDATKESLEQLERLRTLAPHDRRVLGDLIGIKYKHPTGDQCAQIYGAFGEYDLRIMRFIANADKDNKIKCISRLEKIAKFDPKGYFYLGHALEDFDPKRAVRAYEQGMALCRDAVFKSNNCDFLVDYYYDHGERDKAVAMAKEAAAVYSFDGLMTLAMLDEKMHQLAEAEDLYEQVEKRYPSSIASNEWALFPFYYRHQNEKPEYKRALDEISKTFVRGFVKFKKEDLDSPPTYGGKVYAASKLAQSYGIKDDCIVIAVDGYRIANIEDLRRNRNLDPRKMEVEVVFWDGKQYHTVKAAPPYKKYGFELHQWNAK